MSEYVHVHVRASAFIHEGVGSAGAGITGT